MVSSCHSARIRCTYRSAAAAGTLVVTARAQLVVSVGDLIDADLCVTARHAALVKAIVGARQTLGVARAPAAIARALLVTRLVVGDCWAQKKMTCTARVPMMVCQWHRRVSTIL